MKYIKLGTKASSFFDLRTGLTIANNQIVEFDDTKMVYSAKMKRAIADGHISEASNEDFAEFKKSQKSQKEETKKEQVSTETASAEKTPKSKGKETEGAKVDTSKMDHATLVKYIEDTYDITKEDLKVLSSKKKEEILDIIKAW